MSHATPIASVSKPALLLGILLAALFAGCVDNGNDQCVDGVCTQTAQPGDVFVTNATRPVASFPDCRGAYLGLEVPPGLLNGHLPSGFTASGLLPGMANLRIIAVECDRAVIGAHVAEPLHIVRTAVSARPANDTWNPTGLSNFVFEVFVDDDAVAEELRRWGVPAFGASIDVASTPVAVGSRHVWTINAADRSYAFPVTQVDGEGGGGEGQMALWFGAERFRRIDTNMTNYATQGGIGAEPVTMSGKATFAEVLGTSVSMFRTQPFSMYEDEWRLFLPEFIP
jgi:hypothetical protein